MEARGAGADSDGVIDAEVFLEGGFEFRNFGSEGEVAGAHDIDDGGDFGFGDVGAGEGDVDVVHGVSVVGGENAASRFIGGFHAFSLHNAFPRQNGHNIARRRVGVACSSPRRFLMKRSFIVMLAAVVAATGLSAFAANYDVDPVHTTLIYRIKHLQSSYSYGRFNMPTGTFTYDAAAPEQSTFSMTINVDNIDSGNPQRDGHLKSPDFFNAKQFPTITFKSTSVKKSGEDKFDVTGDLTMHGVTKSITVPLTLVGSGKGMAGETRTGFEGVVEFKRSDYGISGLMQAVGDDVRLIVSIEGIQK